MRPELPVANIHRSRKSGFTFRGGVARRETLWTKAGPTSVVIAGATVAVQLFTFGASILALRPFTIVRTRGLMFYRSDQIAATEVWGATLGFAVVTDQANAVGVTAVPTPDADGGSDAFFVYEELYGTLVFGSQIGFQDLGREHRFDSKAMRKVEDGFDLSVVAETPPISSSATMITAFRMLIKLH